MHHTKQLVFLILCLVYVNKGIYAQEAWRTKLKNYDINALVKTFGYDPKITIYEARPGIENKEQIILYVHGWGDSQESINYFKRNSLMLPGTTIGFNFRDAHRAASIPPFWLSNFCQSGDITSFLLVLKMAADCGIKKIHLFGHSRGAGTILTALIRLIEYGKHASFFKALGIDAIQAQNLIHTIASIVLNCPLVDPNMVLKEKLSWANLGWASSLVRRYIIPRLTAYKACNQTPLRAAQNLKKHDFNIPLMIHFQKDDAIVATRVDNQLYRYLTGKDTYVTIGAEGGHMHSGQHFGLVLQAFYKKYDAAYYRNAVALNEGTWLLEQAQPDPDYLDALAEDIYTFKRRGIINYANNPESVWQYNLRNVDIAPITKILGYDPQIRIYGADKSTINSNTTTVYVHGLGENAQTNIPYFKLNSYLLPGTIVGFDFHDVIPGTFSSNFRKLSLAQAEDIATLLMVLKTLDEADLEVIHLFGTSRGGGTIVNTLARLCQYTKYESFFKRLGISLEQASRIFEKIKKGSIVLNVSLVDSNAVAQHWFKAAGSMLINTLVPLLTLHKPRGDQAIDGAKIIQPKDFAILVHFEYKDFIVGNAQDAEFYKNIMGPRTYLVLADEGGHIHSGYTLERAVQAFRKRYGGAYYPLPEVLKEGDRILMQSPNSKEAVEGFVADTYNAFAKQRAALKK